MKKMLLAGLLVSPLLNAEPILQAATSWDGGEIAYPAGQAEITSVILRIEEGAEPPFHCHPVPTMGYTLKGVVEIETQDGHKTVVRAGEPLVEVMRTVHRGVALEGPAEIPFCGRAEEMADLTRAIRRAAPQEAEVILLSGEAGTGKTRMLDETLRGAALDGFTVLRSTCSENIP